MPMAEDPMTDPHTRLAQARFEKELVDSNKINQSDDIVFMAMMAGVIAFFAFVSVVLIFGSFLSVVGFIFAAIFSSGRYRLIRDALIAASIMITGLFLTAIACVIANFVDVADVLHYIGKIATFTDDGTKGIGAMMAFIEDRDRWQYTFMNYQQTAIFVLAVPFFVSLVRNSNQLRSALRGFDEFLGSFGSEYDEVREIAGLRQPDHVLRTVQPTPAKQTIDFGEVGYDRQPAQSHDFDADETTGWEQFQTVLNASIASHSPNYELENVGIIAQELHSSFGSRAVDFAIQTTETISHQKGGEKERVLMECLVSALTKIERAPISSKAS